MVTTVDGTATSATDLVVILPPKPMAFLPAMAVVGTDIIINGTALAGTTSVTDFTGPVSVTVTAVTATSLHAVVPPDALSGPVPCSNPAGPAATTAVSRCCRRSRASGRRARCAGVDWSWWTGSNLKIGATTPTVKIGAFVVPPASITSSPRQLSFTVPLGAVTGKIMVTTATVRPRRPPPTSS